MGKTSLSHRDKRPKEDCRNPYKKAITLRLLTGNLCTQTHMGNTQPLVYHLGWNCPVWRLPFLGRQLPSHTLLRVSQRVKMPHIKTHQGFPDSSVGKESACNAGGPSLTLGSGRSIGEGIGFPLQYSWWFSWLRICLQYGRRGFKPWVGKIPWRRERLSTPVF